MRAFEARRTGALRVVVVVGRDLQAPARVAAALDGVAARDDGLLRGGCLAFSFTG